MATSMRVSVNTSIIQWAVKHGEKSYDDLSQRYPLRTWEKPNKETDHPTFKQLQNFSRDTKIPFTYFFESEVPHEDTAFTKFRTVNNDNIMPSRRLIDTIHAMQSLQSWMMDYLREQGNQRGFDKVHFLKRTSDPEAASRQVNKLLHLSEISTKNQTDEQFFASVRSRISATGIMVMQNGIVGTNTHRPLNVDEFRAFVLVDDYLPLIFINSADSKRAKIFSLVHEFIHALLGQSEVLNVSPSENVKNERWINTVTANTLMPENKIKMVVQHERSNHDNIELVSKKFHTSILAAAIQLSQWHLVDRQDVDWARDEESQGLKNKTKGTGGNYYNNAISRIDRHFANAVINDESSGRLPVASAAKMLGVSLASYKKTVEKLMELE